MAKGNSTRSLRNSDFLVTADDRPGWVRGSDRSPVVGETVYCAGGEGTIVSLHGKTGDGSRLLEIKLADENARAFFAASSNVLLKPA